MSAILAIITLAVLVYGWASWMFLLGEDEREQHHAAERQQYIADHNERMKGYRK